jgi:hypothetical protein
MRLTEISFVGDYRDKVIELAKRFGSDVRREFVGDYRDQIVAVESAVESAVSAIGSAPSLGRDFVGDYRERIVAGAKQVKDLLDASTDSIEGTGSVVDADGSATINCVVGADVVVYFHLHLDTVVTYPNGKKTINVCNDTVKLEVSYDNTKLELMSSDVAYAEAGSAAFTFKALVTTVGTPVSASVVSSDFTVAPTVNAATVVIA